jgi:hypothetical protein
VADRHVQGRGPRGMPAKLAHDAISAGVYDGRQGPGRRPAARQVAPRRRCAEAAAPRAVGHPHRRHAPGRRLSGAFGDTLEREGNPLAVRMAVREGGREVPWTARPWPAPSRTPRRGWRCSRMACASPSRLAPGAERHYGDANTWHGSRLRRDIGFTPVTIRVNTACTSPTTARRLAELLERLDGCWPVPVEESLLVGHSMGGLINRSACHYGMQDGTGGSGRVRNVVTLGTAAPGRPAGAGRHAGLGVALNWTPSPGRCARALARAAWASRTCAIGALVDEDWQGHDPTPGARTPVATSRCSRGARPLRNRGHRHTRLTPPPRARDRRPSGPATRVRAGHSASGRKVAFELDNTRPPGRR